MKKGVVCTSCGRLSRGIRMFCAHCGARLPDAKTVPSGPLKINTGHRTFRNALLFVFVVIGLLILWRVTPLGHMGSLVDADEFEKKLDGVELALRMGEAVSERITEQEINAYLAEAVRHSRGELEAMPTRLMVRDVNIHITPQRVLLVLRADWGPLCLSYSLAGAPVQERPGVSFDVQQVKLGHLPIPFFLRDHMTRRICSIFENLRRIKKIMSKASDVQMGDGALKLTVEKS
ncbi:MAG: hypothetical protein EOM20_13400 [Spartobacteria bacterium]|nr:hypothetical protein [Spartobacteria bacterium]